MTTSGIPDELAGELGAITASAARLITRVSAVNEPLVEGEARAILAFARAAQSATQSSPSELRDNLVAVFSLVTRPTMSDDSPSHTHLLVDAAVNDLRDHVLCTENLAQKLGFAITSDELTLPRSEPVERERVAEEILQLDSRLVRIENEVTGIRTGSIQLGLVNINVEQIVLKIDLERLLLAVKKIVDLQAISRGIQGLLRLIGNAWAVTVAKVSVVGKAIRDAFERMKQEATHAAEIVQKMLAKIRGADATDEPERIWTESEVTELLKSGQKAPAEAARFVRNLEIRRFQPKSLDGLSTLSDLRRIVLYADDRLNIGGLSEIDKLEVIEIDSEHALDLSPIAYKPRLRQLEASASYGGKLTFPTKIDWPNVEKIRFDGDEFNRFPDLSKCLKLKVLDIHSVELELLPTERLPPNLEQLGVGFSGIKGIGTLSHLKKLKSLDVRGSRISDFRFVATAPALSVLQMNRSRANWRVLQYVPRRVEIRGDQGGIIRAGRSS